MKLDKAIEILVHYDDPLRLFTIKETKEAAKLGIEALKQIKWLHESQVLCDDELLPGETPSGNPLPRLAACLNREKNKRGTK